MITANQTTDTVISWTPSSHMITVKTVSKDEPGWGGGGGGGGTILVDPN